jgi:selenide,water dikinase
MVAPSPILKHVVLVGGGHAHAYVLKNLGMHPIPGVLFTLISRDYDTPYSGMIPGHVAGIYTREECHIDLEVLSRFSGTAFVKAEVCGINVREKLIYLVGDRPPISYDIMSIDIGSSPRPMDFTDASIPVTMVKPIDGFSRRWDVIAERAVASDSPFTVAVVGGGAGGVELILSMQVLPFPLRH